MVGVETLAKLMTFKEVTLSDVRTVETLTLQDRIIEKEPRGNGKELSREIRG